jgi:hypothetical protein
MKLIFENWRRYLKEREQEWWKRPDSGFSRMFPHEARARLGKWEYKEWERWMAGLAQAKKEARLKEALPAVAHNSFYEWIVTDRKDEAVLKLANMVKENARENQLTLDELEATAHPASMDHGPRGQVGTYYVASNRLNQIKTEFTVDVFEDLGWRSDTDKTAREQLKQVQDSCHERLRLLDKLVEQFLRSPYMIPPDGFKQGGNIEESAIPGGETPYQACVKILQTKKRDKKAQVGAGEEVSQITDPLENPGDETEAS